MRKSALLQLLIPLAMASAPASALARRGLQDITKDGLPNVQSATALVVDLRTNAVLFEKDADLVRPLASISKIVGALVVHEECGLKPEELHEMSTSNRDAAKGGDKTRLTTGWKYSHRDLMHAALMRSDNRALPALAEACGLDPAKLAERMTERVRKLGLTKTFFREPNGLSPDNVSTAREILIFLREAVKVAELTEIMTKSEYTITGHKEGRAPRPVDIRSTDRLLSKNVATIVGGKTGYTDVARYCFAVAAQVGGRDLGMVFLGAEGRHTRFADFTRVVKWLAPDAAAQGGPSLVQGEKVSPSASGAPGRRAAGVVRAAGMGSSKPMVASPGAGPTIGGAVPPESAKEAAAVPAVDASRILPPGGPVVAPPETGIPTDGAAPAPKPQEQKW